MRTSRKTLLLAALLPFSGIAMAKQAINVSLPIDTQIERVLVLAQYVVGDCSHPETPRKDKRSAGLPQVDRCLNFPHVLAETLTAQGVDVQLEVFNPPEPMSSAAYLTAAAAWSTQQRKDHPERYVLDYRGQQLGRQYSFMFIALEAPGTGTRAPLGHLDLGNFWFDSYGKQVSQAQQALVVANTLHHRCPLHGPRQNCNDRLALIERIAD